jgi:hypothetical protein
MTSEVATNVRHIRVTECCLCKWGFSFEGCLGNGEVKRPSSNLERGLPPDVAVSIDVMHGRLMGVCMRGGNYINFGIRPSLERYLVSCLLCNFFIQHT